MYIVILSSVLHSACEQLFRQVILSHSPWKPQVPEMTEPQAVLAEFNCRQKNLYSCFKHILIFSSARFLEHSRQIAAVFKEQM